MKLLEDIVAGKTVALVGNAMSMMKVPVGAAIDYHDVVIRMNCGLPGIMPVPFIGSKTTIWATAKRFPQVRRDVFRAILFMKLTELGDREWGEFMREKLPVPLVRWPRDLEQEVAEFVGADPGTGIRLLYWLKRKANPKKLSVFGMDCWQTPSNWSKRMNTPNHKPDLERIAMDKLL